MESEGIEVALAKAIDLRLKINNCIHKATSDNTTKTNHQISASENKEEGGKGNGNDGVDKEKGQNSELNNGGSWSEPEEDDEEAERLLHIGDALESLENQLSHLQALQQQQHYEREVALAEIEHNRQMLFSKLKEYKGKDLEVIKEASSFVGETVESDRDLMLPPYPSRLPQSPFADNHFLSNLPFSKKPARNGVPANEMKKNAKDLESDKVQATPQNSCKGLGQVIGVAAKTMITVVGVISVLSMSGFGPSLAKRYLPLNILGLFQQPNTDQKRQFIECPPGRVLVVEDGEARCVVRERVAVPFESVVTKPDVNYGCG